MITIEMQETDIKIFNDLIKLYPENVVVNRDIGFDGNATIQLVIEVVDKLIPTAIAAIGVLLTYKANKRTAELKELEHSLHEHEMQLKEEEMHLKYSDTIEIRCCSNGDSNIIVKTTDLNKGLENVDILIDKVKKAFNNECSEN